MSNIYIHLLKFGKDSLLIIFIKYFIAICLFVLIVNNQAYSIKSIYKDTIILQLKWKHQFQFAGYYAAIEKGFYKQAGLTVKLIEAKNGEEAIPSVTSGLAQYGIATSDLLLSRNTGFPVVLLANIFQHSSLIFLSTKQDSIDNIHDLACKTIMLEKHAAELLAYLKSEQILVDSISFLPHAYTPEALIKGEVSAISAYSTDEPYLLKESGIDYNIFNPRSSGIDFYGDVLFTSEHEIKENPERVKLFLQASLQGWKYALENEDEIIETIYNNYSKRHTKEHLKFEAQQTKRLIMPEVVEIGYVNKDRWQRIGEIYAELNMLPSDFSLKRFIYNRNPVPGYWIITPLSMTILGITILVIFVAFWFYRLNKRLKAESKVREEKEQQLTELEKRYRNLSENAPFPIFISEPQSGKILYMNQRACEKFEISRNYALQTQTTSFYVDLTDRKELVRKLQNHGFVKDSEILMKSVGGKEFWAYISSNLITFDNKPALFSAIVDISARIKFEKELKEANASKDKLFSIIAHDLKSPIGNIAGILDLSVKYLNNKLYDKLMMILIDCNDAAKSSFNLLENLFDWAKNQINEFDFLPEKFKINDIIEESVNVYKSVANTKKITFEFIIDNGIWVYADINNIKTVIRNLVSNAIKFSYENSTIKIIVKKDTDNCFCSIIDSGVGVSKEKASTLFNVRTINSTFGTNGERGTGLGLNLCAEFVRKNNGKIAVNSKIEKGSEFYFTIPLYDSKHEEINRTDKLDIYNKKAILIADDNDLNFMNLNEMLKSFTIKVFRAHNGNEAVSICQNSKIDLVFMDLKMPVMNGFDATKEIKEFCPDLPIIAQIAYHTSKDKEKAVKAGFDNIISKPINEKLLDRLIQEYFMA